jgi:HEAT repeat protein
MWFDEGRRMQHIVDAIAMRLDHETPEHPSRDAANLCWAFGELGDRRRSTVAVLIRLLDTSDEVVRTFALDALVKQGQPGDVKALSRWMTLGSPLRGDACEAAVHLHAKDPRTLAFFETLLNDKTASTDLVICAQRGVKQARSTP